MADNTTLNAGSGGDTIRDVAKGAGVKTPVCILDVGAGASESLLSAGQAAMAASLPVAIASNQSAVPVSAAALPLPAGAAADATVASLSAKVTACNTGAVVISAALPAGGNTVGAVDLAQYAPAAGRLPVDGSGVVQPVSQAAATTGGATPYHLVSAATTNSTVVKPSPGQLYGIQVFNTNAAARWLKLYDKATAPAPGTDMPVKTILVPGASAGAGAVIPLGGIGLVFAAGISLAITAAAADADATAIGAGDVVVNLDYK